MLQGRSIKCFLDGRMVGDAIRRNLQPVYAVGGLDGRTGEVVVTAVNPNETATETIVDLEDLAGVAAGSRAVVLTSGSADDENSFEASARVAPHEEALVVAGPRFSHTFPANSRTVLRIKIAQ